MDYPLRYDDRADAENYPGLSALNDLLFCPRRCALHRVEGVWTDNVHTLAGSLEHRRPHEPRDRQRQRRSLRIARALRLVSHRLKLVGVADVVEFHRPPGRSKKNDATTETPYPVEYKHGKKKRWINDDVQLCAQALCLEEMLGLDVPEGAVYHVQSKAGRVVPFTDELRRQTEDAVQRLHRLLESRIVPHPILLPRCRGCSLKPFCLPEILSRGDLLQKARDQLFTPIPSEPPP